MNSPIISVSWGELIDKITILEIKLEKMVNPEAISNVKREIASILPECQPVISQNEELSRLKNQLSSVNNSLWEIEDDIRDKESQKIFDDVFIRLARSVYFKNDERAQIKRRINKLMNSDLVEEKSYKPY